MGALGEARRDENTHIIESEGCDSTLGNGETIKSFWQNAGIIAIQRFLNANEWALSAFEVRLPYYALSSPYSLKNGDEITQDVLDWRCVVRNITPELNDNVVVQCNALVVMTTD